MPEGDSIHRLAAEIGSRIVGRTIVWSIFRHPRLAALDLTGRTPVDASSHGKHLFLHLDDGWSLHVHLLLDGRVRFGPAGRTEPVEAWRRRFELVLGGDGDDAGGDGGRDGIRGGGRLTGVRMTGVDIPLLHRIRIADAGRVVGHLGPDLCGHLDAGDFEVALSRLTTDPAAPLAGALLDQRNVAGFGNVYAIEVPYLCGVSPFRPVGGIIGLGDLLAIGAALIRTNARLGPQNTTGRRLSRSDHWIIADRRRSCLLCGTAIRVLPGHASPWRRGTASCPTCQDGSNDVVDVARARRLLALHPARRLLAFGDGDGDPGRDGSRLDGARPTVELVGSPEPVEVRRLPGR